ncbi:Potassium channel [Xylographa trunciseda]|nr:Potassium channel [Xylographa trunciseda]
MKDPITKPIRQAVLGKDESETTRPEDYVHKAEEEAEEDPTSPSYDIHWSSSLFAEHATNCSSRWWFSSTLFPLIAATFGPLATAFNICALVMDWRVVVDPSSTEATGIDIRDPDWLDAVNAISLFTSVAANLMLLAHMTGRISFPVAQPATIVLYYLTSFLLIGLVTAAPAHLELPAGEDRTFSQGYYYAIIAAAVTFVLGSMMVITAFGVYIGHYSREFKLTMSQRTLIFQTTTFIGYILAAGAVYSKVEGWDFLDGVYYVDVTILTIGFGDFSPKTHLGRSLLFPMAVGGILFLGLIIASIRTLVLERGTKKVTVRMLEKARQTALKKGDLSSGTIQVSPGKKRNIAEGTTSELGRREQEFNIMREVQRKAGKTNSLIALSVSTGAAFFLWFVGAAVFQQAELKSQGWSYFEALYFTYVSLLTIGYGDFYPQTNSGKPAFVFWSLLALPTLTVLIGSIGDSISDGVGELTLWIGDHLPEKSSALKDLKGEANKSKKEGGGGFQEAKPPGFMSDGAGTDEESQSAGDRGDEDAKAQNDVHSASKAGKHYRRYLIMRQIKTTVKQMDATPPRQYSYAEWTWILKLLGEDESSSTSHRSAEATEDAEDAGHPDSKSWSWLGQNSPLMSGEDEPKWVLQRLMDLLEKDLKEEGDEHNDNETQKGLDELNNKR